MVGLVEEGPLAGTSRLQTEAFLTGLLAELRAAVFFLGLCAETQVKGRRRQYINWGPI
jgi:hypothetical protein